VHQAWRCNAQPRCRPNYFEPMFHRVLQNVCKPDEKEMLHWLRLAFNECVSRFHSAMEHVLSVEHDYRRGSSHRHFVHYILHTLAAFHCHDVLTAVQHARALSTQHASPYIQAGLSS